MTPDRKKPGVAFWATVVVVAVGLYPLSFGPFVWLASRDLVPPWATLPLMAFFRPLNWIAFLPGPIDDSFDWYVRLWK